MKAKTHRKRSGIRHAPGPAPKRARKVNSQSIGGIRPRLVESFGDIDEEEALAVGESLDECEKRG
jgi:hypothetical protein